MTRYLTLVMILLACTISAGTVASETITMPAAQSHTGQAFTYTRTLREKNPHATIYDVSFPSPVVSPHPANNTVPGELYLPVNVTQKRDFPAVVCLHILNGNFDLERAVCLRLAQRGVIAFLYKQPYYGERGGTEGKKLLATSADVFVNSFDQGFADTRRSLDILQSLPEVNPAQLGITGISMGAIQAARACGYDARINRAFIILGGSELRKIIETARETRVMRGFINRLPAAEQKKVWDCFERIDPIQAKEALQRLARSNRLRMINAERDQVIPASSSLKLAQAAGCTNQLSWLPGLDHYSAMARLPLILNDVAAFFGEDVPSNWQPSAPAASKTPTDLFGHFLTGLAAFFGGQPQAGTAHMVGIETEFKVNGKNRKVTADFVRGEQGRFKITGDLPKVGTIGLGQGAYPWIIGGDKVVFCGTEMTDQAATASALITPERLLKYQVVNGVLGAAAFSPAALNKYYTLEEGEAAHGNRTIKLRIDHKRTKGTLNLTFAADATPLSAAWDFGKAVGEARFTHWRLNTVSADTIFEPPSELPPQAVHQEDLLRMFAALFEFIVETVE